MPGTTRACLVVLVVALAFLIMECAAAGTAGGQRRRQVQSLLKRLNKPPLASIKVMADLSVVIFYLGYRLHSPLFLIIIHFSSFVKDFEFFFCLYFAISLWYTRCLDYIFLKNVPLYNVCGLMNY